MATPIKTTLPGSPKPTDTAPREAAFRNFYEDYVAHVFQGTTEFNANIVPEKGRESRDQLLETIRSSIIGRDEAIETPFGLRPIVYADYTASGRSLSFIEDYLRNEVIPVYANTHTLTSANGLQTTLFRREARDIVKRSVHGSKDDVVFFTGTGTTGAVLLLVHVLSLKERSRTATSADEKPVVFVGPYEHHSNMLPWREAGVDVITIAEAKDGGPDLAELEAQLTLHKTRPLKIGSFAVASNVSGILTDTPSVTALLHKFGALSVWDYASAAPYVDIDMNPKMDTGIQSMYAKDAIVFSPHKFVGGPSTPGVLVIKKALLVDAVPFAPGGGTVFFVTSENHLYLQNFEEREEGGTPDIIGSVRAGLVFQLKQAVGVETIAAKEAAFCETAMKAWSSHRNIVLVGNNKAQRLPIISFVIRFQNTNLFLHSNFVAALLNDLFGLQTRAGCVCAGPYAQSVLGLDSKKAMEFEDSLLAKNELVRPGFVRVNFNYFASQEEVDYIISAVTFVAEHGWKLLPQYGFFADSGEWKHRSRMTKFVNRRWLGSISYASGKMQYRSEHREAPAKVPLSAYLKQAREIVDKAVKSAPTAMVDQGQVLSESAARLRWFVLPSEALLAIHGNLDKAVKEMKCAIQPGAFPVVKGAHFPLSNAVLSSNSEPQSGSNNADSVKECKDGCCKPGSAECKTGCCDSGTASSGKKKGKQSSNAAPTTATAREPEEVKEKKAKAGELDVKESKLCDTDLSDAAVCKMKSKAVRDEEAKERAKHADAVCKNCFHKHTATGTGVKPGGLLTSKECMSCECVSFVPRIAKSEKEINKIGVKIRGLVGRAVSQYGMIKDGDRVLVGVSGGKDSLTMIHMLLQMQKRAPIRFEIGACTIDPQHPEYDPSILKVYFKQLGIPYFYESQPIMDNAQSCIAKGNSALSICAYCARMKRGILYTTCRREGYNVLALGQHLDDLAESFLMSAFYNGFLRTMKAHYHSDGGDIRIIRPLTFVRERMTREYAKAADLPVINENCPACFEAPKERQRVKLLLASQEHIHPNLFSCLLRTMLPLIGLENTRLKTGDSEDAELGSEGDDIPSETKQTKKSKQQQQGKKPKDDQPAKMSKAGTNASSSTNTTTAPVAVSTDVKDGKMQSQTQTQTQPNGAAAKPGANVKPGVMKQRPTKSKAKAVNGKGRNGKQQNGSVSAGPQDEMDDSDSEQQGNGTAGNDATILSTILANGRKTRTEEKEARKAQGRRVKIKKILSPNSAQGPKQQSQQQAQAEVDSTEAQSYGTLFDEEQEDRRLNVRKACCLLLALCLLAPVFIILFVSL